MSENKEQEINVFGEIKEIDKANLTKKLFDDVMFFQIAEGGAMGEAGGVVFINENGESFHLNYCEGDITFSDLLLVFQTLENCYFGFFGMGAVVPEGWNYADLGMGNHLLIASPVYDEFKELTKDVKRSCELYSCWYENAIKIIRNLKKQNV